MTMPGLLICSRTSRQRLRRWTAGSRNRVSKGGSEKRTAAEKRKYIRYQRPRGLSVAEGCILMSLSRSTYYDKPASLVDERAIGCVVPSSRWDSQAVRDGVWF